MVKASLQEKTANGGLFQRNFSTFAGVSLCSVAILAYWYGSYTFIPLEYHMLTLPFMTAGLILILFGTEMVRQLIFPIGFLFFLTPPPDEILYGAGTALANLSALASSSLANVFGLHATLSASNVGPIITLARPNLTVLTFNVDVACSGIYSIIGFIIFALFIAYITRGKLANKLAILVMGIPLILVLNIIRVTTILAIGYNFGEDLALTLFHDVGATVLMFIGVLILLGVTDKVFKKPKPATPCPACYRVKTKPSGPFCNTCGKLLQFTKTRLHRKDLIKIVSIALVSALVFSIQAPVFALTQGPAQVMIQTPSGTQINPSSSMLPTIPGYTVKYAYRDTSFEKTSGDDAALVYYYSPNNGTGSTVWISIQIASSVTSEHRWETCLISFPLSVGEATTVSQLDLRDAQLQDNPPVTARYFAFNYIGTNQTQVVFYWYETAIFDSNSTAQSKSIMISLIMYPTSNQTVADDENQEMPIAREINNYWQPIRTWSVITLALSQNGLALSVAASVVFGVLVVYEAFLVRKEKKLLLNLYGKLSMQNKNIVQAVENARKQGPSTVDAVLVELQKLPDPTTDKTLLNQKLVEAENAGLVERAIANKDDEPVISWKSQVPSQKPFLTRLGRIGSPIEQIIIYLRRPKLK